MSIVLLIKNLLALVINNYAYSADGKKLKVEMKYGNQTKTTDYVSNVIYENGSLKRILITGGYIENNKYHFFIQDHLGNNRAVAQADGTVIQTNHYYPYGMTFTEDNIGDPKAQPYKYGGKEFDGERGLNLYDFLARSEDAVEGRFTGVDPLAEKYYSISPYVYCANNLVKFVDPDGRKIKIKGDDEYKEATLNNLQQLSSSKLLLLKNGTVVEASSYKGKSSNIAFAGTVTNNGKSKVNGTALVHDVVSDKHTVTIQGGKKNEFEPTSSDNASNPKIGSGGILSFNNEPTGVVRNIVNQNGTDHVSDQSVLGHELLHARHSFQGTVSCKNVNVQDPDRNNWTYPMSREELRTRSFKNYIRREQGDEPRAQPTINNQ